MDSRGTSADSPSEGKGLRGREDGVSDHLMIQHESSPIPPSIHRARRGNYALPDDQQPRRGMADAGFRCCSVAKGLSGAGFRFCSVAKGLSGAGFRFCSVAEGLSGAGFRFAALQRCFPEPDFDFAAMQRCFPEPGSPFAIERREQAIIWPSQRCSREQYCPPGPIWPRRAVGL